MTILIVSNFPESCFKNINIWPKNGINHVYYDDSDSFYFPESCFKNINIWPKNGINRAYSDDSGSFHFPESYFKNINIWHEMGYILHIFRVFTSI